MGMIYIKSTLIIFCAFICLNASCMGQNLEVWNRWSRLYLLDFWRIHCSRIYILVFYRLQVIDPNPVVEMNYSSESYSMQFNFLPPSSYKSRTNATPAQIIKTFEKMIFPQFSKRLTQVLSENKIKVRQVCCLLFSNNLFLSSFINETDCAGGLRVNLHIYHVRDHWINFYQ